MKNKFNKLIDVCNIFLVLFITLNVFICSLYSENNVVVEKIPKDEIYNNYFIEEVLDKNKPKDVVIEVLVGSMSGYGPDCYGCTSGLTASGKYVGNGNIYYDDPTYGTIRIVAADASYPFGTIVKISNVDLYNNEPFYAIVLDRGGDIGKGRRFLFDLLFASEKETHQLGVDYNVNYEIVRLGY